MVKHKVPADVRSLADRYFCEQCDRLGLPRPHPIAPISRCSGKPLKAPRHAFKPRKQLSDVAELAWVNTHVDPALIAKDREDGLAIEAMLANEKAPRMGLDAILKAYGDGER